MMMTKERKGKRSWYLNLASDATLYHTIATNLLATTFTPTLLYKLPHQMSLTLPHDLLGPINNRAFTLLTVNPTLRVPSVLDNL